LEVEKVKVKERRGERKLQSPSPSTTFTLQLRSLEARVLFFVFFFFVSGKVEDNQISRSADQQISRCLQFMHEPYKVFNGELGLSLHFVLFKV
jgi:hypothetical protein